MASLPILQSSHLLEDIESNAPAVKLKRTLRTGMITIGVLVFGLGGLAGTLPITGAVIASGEVGMESRIKKIAHPTGGVIAAILVKDGDRVRKGQVLIRLDTRVSGANAQYTGENVDQLTARAARLRADRDDARTVSFPAGLISRARDPAIAKLMQDEMKTFLLRRKALAGQISQLRERIAQTQAQVGGFQTQAQSYDQQSSLIKEELDATRKLYDERYTTLEKLNALERAAVGVSASAAGARSSLTEANARIVELQRQADSMARDFRSQAALDLLETESKISELQRMKVAADDSVDRSAITAPQDGIVDKLATNTIGGVIPPGDTIMEIVPDADQLIVRAKVLPADIDQVARGRSATLRFTAFSSRTTPELDGTVQEVAADRTVDQPTGFSYYTATITISRSELSKLGKQKLIAGMPVEAFIQSGSRTLLGYVLKPLHDQLMRSFRQN